MKTTVSRRVGLATLLFLGCALSLEAAKDTEKGYIKLFNGKDLTGWRASEKGDFRVEKGAIVVRGERAHLFTEKSFKNFDFKCEIMTEPGSNSGIYFHTSHEETWPSRGYEVQVNCTHTDPVRNGSLWGVVKVYQPNAKDNEWYTMQITVNGQNVVTRVNGKLVVDYTELPGVTSGRRIDKGSIAFQAHDPKSVIRYRNVRIKPLPDP